jgi:hypothetical protein
MKTQVSGLNISTAPSTDPLQVRNITLLLGAGWRRAVNLSVDIFPQIFPDVSGQFEEYTRDLGIKLTARPFLNLFARGLAAENV